MTKRIAMVLLTTLCLGSCATKKSTNKPLSEKVFTPEKILPDGTDTTLSVNPYTGVSAQARMGTVAATLNNVALLNKLLLLPATPETAAEIDEIARAVKVLLPSLRAIGMFNFFSVDEWLGDHAQPGRAVVALWYLQKYPEEISPTVKRSLREIGKTDITRLANEIKEVNLLSTSLN